MRFVTAGAVSNMGTAPARTDRPQWLRDWIANRTRYVLLECGHKESLANSSDVDSTIALIQVFDTVEIECGLCSAFKHIDRSLDLFEYMGVDRPVIGDSPLF